jgi:hypothetical protein
MPWLQQQQQLHRRHDIRPNGSMTLCTNTTSITTLSINTESYDTKHNNNEHKDT